MTRSLLGLIAAAICCLLAVPSSSLGAEERRYRLAFEYNGKIETATNCKLSGEYNATITHSGTKEMSYTVTGEGTSKGVERVSAVGRLKEDVVNDAQNSQYVNDTELHRDDPLTLPGTFGGWVREHGRRLSFTYQNVGAPQRPVPARMPAPGKSVTVRVGGGSADNPPREGCTVNSTKQQWSGTATITRIDKGKKQPKPRKTKLKAHAGADYTGARGQTVALDGSRSVGDITDYDWTFSGASCGGLRPGARKSGAEVDVVPLCGVTAKLTVSDGERTDSDTARIKVKGLRKVPFEHHGERTWSLPFDLSQGGTLGFGLNRSQPEWDADHDVDARNHWIEPSITDAGASRDAIQVAQVDDPEGPWDGRYYVAHHTLSVDRVSVINSQLLPGGFIHDLNASHRRDLAAIVAQVRAHERAHSTLAEKALRTDAGDPVRGLQASIGESEEQVRTKAGMAVRDAEAALVEGSSEARVKRVLRDKYGNRTATIVVPSHGPVVRKTFRLAEIGD